MRSSERRAGRFSSIHAHCFCGRANSSNDAVATQAQFNDIWDKLSQHFKGNEAIWAYGLANEPHNEDGTAPDSFVYSMQQGAIDTIRGNGDNTRILVSRRLR
jgi:hypothetical protein